MHSNMYIKTRHLWSQSLSFCPFFYSIFHFVRNPSQCFSPRLSNWPDIYCLHLAYVVFHHIPQLSGAQKRSVIMERSYCKYDNSISCCYRVCEWVSDTHRSLPEKCLSFFLLVKMSTQWSQQYSGIRLYSLHAGQSTFALQSHTLNIVLMNG